MAKLSEVPTPGAQLRAFRESHGLDTHGLVALINGLTIPGSVQLTDLVHNRDIRYWEGSGENRSATKLSLLLVQAVTDADIAAAKVVALEAASHKPKSVRTKLTAKEAAALLTPEGFARWTEGKPLSAVDFYGKVLPE